MRSLLALATLVLLAMPVQGATCGEPELDGSANDTWSDNVSFGPAGASWQPYLVSTDATLQALTSVMIRLEWNNTVTGAADFGIAVGTPSGFQYWNQNTNQAAPGSHSESITLERDELNNLGWTGEELEIGPSISTGGGSFSGIDYTLTWSIAIDEQQCNDEGLSTPTDGGLIPAGGDVPIGWWLLAGMAGLAFIALAVIGTRKR